MIPILATIFDSSECTDDSKKMCCRTASNSNRRHVEAIQVYWHIGKSIGPKFHEDHEYVIYYFI